MQRLVYSPRAYVFIKDQSGTIHNVSDYVTAGNVTRRIDQVSSAMVTLRNPEMKFTAHRIPGKNQIALPTFSPMDPITIYLRRRSGHPVRVFTGFLDRTPYLQLFPGTVTLQASCTLKRLLYTYFDPALPYTQSFLREYGWLEMENGVWGSFAGLDQYKRDGAAPKADSIESKASGSISELLYATMKHIGHWNHESIYIEKLPDDLYGRLTELAQEFQTNSDLSKKAFENILKQIAGSGSQGGGGGAGAIAGGNISSSSGVTVKGNAATPEQINNMNIAMGEAAKANAGPRATIALIESIIVESEFLNKQGSGRDSVSFGLIQAIPGTSGKPGGGTFTKEEALDPEFSCRAALLDPGPTGSGGLIKIAKNNPSWTPGQVGKFVINSKVMGIGDDAYVQKADSWRGEADKIIAAYNSGGSAGGTAPDSQSTTGGRRTSSTTDNTTSTTRATTSSGSTKSGGGSDKVFKLCNSWSKGGGWGGAGGHLALDMLTDGPKVFYAPVRAKVIDIHDGWWGKGAPTGSPEYIKGDGVLRLEVLDDHGPIKKGTILGYGHGEKYRVRQGDTVEAGAPVCESGLANAWHIHFFVGPPGSDARDGKVDPMPYVDAFESGDTSKVNDPGATTSGDAGQTSSSDSGGAAALFSTLNLPGALDTIAANMLSGEKSLMNDKPLMPFVQQLCNAGLRHFQSMPDGKFYAFYPDYFGEFYQHPPYWEIDDIEIINGGVDLDDTALVTHAYVVGDTASPTIGATAPFWVRAVFSAGVVTIFNAFVAGDVLDRSATRDKLKDAKDPPKGMGISLEYAEANSFLERYGARPNTDQDEPLIKSNFYEMFLAYQRFMLGWSRQFLSQFTFTFMPEIYPGGKVGFPDHDLQLYVEEVSHSWDYTTGFLTQASLSAPSIYHSPGNKSGRGMLPPNMVRALIEPVSEGRKREKDKPVTVPAPQPKTDTGWFGPPSSWTGVPTAGIPGVETDNIQGGG